MTSPRKLTTPTGPTSPYQKAQPRSLSSRCPALEQPVSTSSAPSVLLTEAATQGRDEKL